MKLLALLILFSALYGWHVATSPFVYEDMHLVGADRHVSWAGALQPRGLTTESWVLIQSPQASHALNVSLHLVVVGLVGLLLWRITRDAFAAHAGALIMAFHPLTGETVAYAASRSELIAAVGAILVLVCAVSPSPWTWGVIPPAFALAYMGKETGLVAIGLVPLVLWMQGERRWAWRLTALVCSVVVVIALWRWPALQALSHHGEYGDLRVSPGAWVATQTAAVGRLALLSMAPIWLSVSPAVEPLPGYAAMAALILACGLVECVWRLSSVAPLAAGGIVGCAIVAAPRFVVRTPGSPFNEHQWYVAMPFVACVLVAGLQACETWWQTMRAEVT